MEQQCSPVYLCCYGVLGMPVFCCNLRQHDALLLLTSTLLQSVPRLCTTLCCSANTVQGVNSLLSSGYDLLFTLVVLFAGQHAILC